MPDSPEIRAMQFLGDFDAVERFVGGDAEYRHGELVVATPDGALYAKVGEWIIRDPDGRFRASSTAPAGAFTLETPR